MERKGLFLSYGLYNPSGEEAKEDSQGQSLDRLWRAAQGLVLSLMVDFLSYVAQETVTKNGTTLSEIHKLTERERCAPCLLKKSRAK